ncbi:hypothetical protein ACI5KX_09575 [Erythrobacter sp. GH1-10]|uniref:hypothetical protein n=1 Tax=Erythrobacter sp. GH1-10 TaxID=3349334 RepID=UPI003877DDA5
MKSTLSLIAAPAALFVAAPLFAASALSPDPQDETSQETAQDQTDEAKDEKDASASVMPEVKAEEERTCRYVKLDMSSRRKSKVCKTADEWREFNQRR